MAYLIQPDYVRYSCSCGKNKPITLLYFCRHCLKIRCGSCICHEVDSHYCANCLENMPSSEARLKKNRCISCFDCPSCFHTLSTRATMAAQPRPAPSEAGDPIEPKQPKKMYYLSCFNCRWTSRDVGIPDQPVASGGWPERLNAYTQRVNSIHDHYKSLAQQEKQDKLERERKKFTIRGKYHTLTDKIGLTGAMARNIAGLSSDNGAFNSLNPPRFAHSQPSAEVNDLPDDIFTKEVNLKQITNMAQRLAVAEWQPTTVDRLHPIPKLLSIKRSQRCRSCDHNLTKPEYNPGSIKFKIELLAYYHVPEVRIISCDSLKPGGRSSLLLKFSNPTGYEMTFRLLPLNPKVEDNKQEEENMQDEGKTEEDGSETKKDESKGEERRPADVAASNAQLQVPDVRLTLAQRDDAAEYDEDASSYNDHPDLVLWRKSNKMALRLSVQVDDDLADGTEVNTGFIVEYSYMNTVPPTASNQPRQPQEHTLNVTVYVNLGNVIC